MPPTRLLPLLTTLLLAACVSAVPQAPPTLTTAPGPATASVPEAFVSPAYRGDELDSLATWNTPDGRIWVIATAKASHRLLVFDGHNGQLLRTFGAAGRGAGEFTRPNGIAVSGDLLFVTERDAPGVQVLALPDFTPVTRFGQDTLRSPYGIWLHETAPGALEVYVTDSFMDGADYSIVPALHELDQRVRRYAVQQLADGQARIRYRGAFGDTQPENALRVVESIAGDPARDRLLIAEEDGQGASTLHAYTLDGRFTGLRLPPGRFEGDAEGLALWSCSPQTAYWIATDQLHPLTRFHVLDRDTLDLVGQFSGQVTANTDGISLHAARSAQFPAGVLYAVHDDRAVAAFNLADVARALHLHPDCAR